MPMPIETTFRSDESFTVRGFRRWVEARPMSDINRYELVAGRIVMTPPAGWTHASLGARIGRLLGAHVERHALGTVFDSSLGCRLPTGDVLEPDVSFVSTARFEANPPVRSNEFLRAVPDLVVEILSPGTAVRDQTEKKTLYEQNGVDEYWIVDGDEQTVTVFTRRSGGFDAGRVLSGGVLRSRVLPKLRMPLTKLFDS
jgi:Uma2 family endonuclease